MRIHHQPGGIICTAYIHLETRKCRACWECIRACPNDVIGRINLLFHKHARIEHPEKCKGCRKCVKACQEEAISLLNEAYK